jgi:ATP-dependent RNA helicase HelY
VMVLTEDRRVRRVLAREFPSAPVPLGRVTLPRTLSPKSPRFKARVAEALAALDLPDQLPPLRRPRATAADDDELVRLRAQLREHPVHACPDRADHERWMQRWDQLERDTSALQAKVRRRTGSLVRTFDRVLAVLAGLGYVEGFSLTEKGETLRRVYNEADLVVVEALHRGVCKDLDPPELAAVLSTLVYEPRGREAPAGPVLLPTERTRMAVEALADVEGEVQAHERSQGLTLTRPLELDFAERTWRWARGDRLEDVLGDDSDVTPGDFVRVMKQLIDLLRQVATVAGDPTLVQTARAAVDACQRGVVAYSSLL